MVAVKKQSGREAYGFVRVFEKNWPYYVMLLTGIIYIVMFKYIPMMGSVIAFKDYSAYQVILDSPWCGLENFKKLFQYPDFYKILGNTLILGALKTFLTFPIPVILALMLNEIRNAKVKKVVQTIICIVLPASKAVLATVGLFYGVTMWNQYEHPMMFIQNMDLFPLQMKIRSIVDGGSELQAITMMQTANYTPATLSAVAVVFAIIPIRLRILSSRSILQKEQCSVL